MVAVGELELLESPRFLAGSRADLEVTCYRDGTLTDPASAGTVTVTDEDGNVLSSGAAIVVGGSSGQLRYQPTAAAMANVNRLTVTWADVVLGSDPAITLTTYAECVGDMLFTEAQARAYGDGGLANATTYPDDLVRRGHDRIWDAFESIVNYPLGRRYQREVLDGGSTKLRLSKPYVRSIRAVSTRTSGTQTWTAYGSTALAGLSCRPWGLLLNELSSFPAGNQNVRVSYEAGKPIPGSLRLAALRLLRHQLVPSNISDRALYESNQLGQFRMAVADPTQFGRWFGIPDVDAALADAYERQIY